MPPGRAATSAGPGSDAGARWLARLAFAAAAAAVGVLLAFTGRGGVLALTAGIGGLAASLAGTWWLVAHRGPARWFGGVLAVAAPIAMVAVYAHLRLCWVAGLSALLWFGAVWAGRAALAGKGRRPTEIRVAAPRRPYLIMNPASGGGKVARFGLADRARALGAEVAVLDGPGHADVAAMAREAAARGADLVGVAGGDGTLARVAAVAAELGLPFMVVPAGTRNHFGLDLGLDCTKPGRCVDALTDGVELRVDLGFADDRAFVNNASFGAYADLVQGPDYRNGKARIALERLPDLLSGTGDAGLVACADGVRIESPHALLVSCNPYQLENPTGLGRRVRLDGAVLGVLAVRVHSALQAAELLRGRRAPGLTRLSADRVTVDADVPRIPVGIDGEAALLATPVRCAVRGGVLRVRVPRHRPGVRVFRPRIDWRRLRQLALTRAGTGDR
jgi:diacylglycerol kinase family enzyme